MAASSPEQPAAGQPEHSRRRFLNVLGKAGLVTVGGLTVPILAAPGAPAAAHAIQGPTGCNGWNSNHTICNGCSVSRGNVVRMWQCLVWTFGGGAGLGSFTSFVDGIFGPNTAYATRYWQDWQNIQIDGVVGPQSWRTMRCTLAFKRTLGGYNYYEYEVTNRARIGLRRTVSSGLWYYRVFSHAPNSAGAHGYRITSHS